MKRIAIIFLLLFVSNLLYADWVKDILNKYPEADAIIMNDSTMVNVNIEGKGTIVSYTKKGILTDKGVRDNSMLTFSYDKNYTEFNVKEVRLIKNSGDTINVDFQNLMSEQTNPTLYQMNIYDTQEKSVYIPIEGLEKGDIIEYKVEYKMVKLPMDSTYSDIYLMQYLSPIQHTIYILSLPKQMPLKWKLRDKVKKVSFTKIKDKEKIIYKWEANNIPQIIYEPMMPPLQEVAMRIVMSTITSWEDVSKWYYSITQSHLKITDKMKTTVDSLLGNSETREDSLSAIFYYVSRNVRYMGLTLETNKPGYEPHDVSLTFDNMYGVCRDKAALLVALLRIAGFDSWPILINVSFKLDKEIPVVYFNHAITAVQNPDGSYIIMDATSEQTRVFLPEYEMDKTFIVAKEDGAGLQLTPVSPIEKDISLLVAEQNVYKDRVVGYMFYEPHGMDDQIFRYVLMMRKDKERLSFLEHFIKQYMPIATIDSIFIDGLKEDGKNLLIKTYFHYPVSKDSLISIIPLSYKNAFIEWNNMFVGYAFSTISRQYPVHLYSLSGYKFLEKINLYDDIKSISLPKDYEYRLDKGFLFYSHIKMNKDNITINSKKVFEKLNYSLKEYEQIRRFLSLGDAYKNAPILLVK